jgi:chaperonin GroES
MAAKLQPLADRLVVKPTQKEEKTKGGIYLPDTLKKNPKKAK